MERKRRISAPFLRTGLNNYRQSKTAVQPENTIIALIQAGIADNIFSPIMLRLPDPCRHDRRDIVVAHGLIGICEDDLAFLRVLDHAGLQVVANGSYRNAAEVLIHVDVAPDPGVHLHIKGGLDIGVTAVGQAGNKEIDFDLLAVRLGDPHCWAAPVHFATLPRFMLEVAADRRFRAILVVVVTELCFPDRDVAFGKALFSVLLP